MPLRIFLVFIFLSAFGFISHSQQYPLYTYQQLSDVYYARQKDSLKKNWECPDVFPTKATQKKLRELWDDRTNFITAAIASQNYVYEPAVYNYLLGILQQITAANPTMFSGTPMLAFSPPRKAIL